jgi:hypothetical protein
MAIESTSARRLMHTRKIDINGWLRDDGLWDIEATLLDTKPFVFHDLMRGPMEPGRPMHSMRLTLTLDDSYVIRQVAVDMPGVPFPSCPEVVRSLDPLIGAQVGSGWRATIRALIPRLSTCTHVAELLIPMASAAYQTMAFGKDIDNSGRVEGVDTSSKPLFVDGCHSWRTDGPNIARFYPQFARKKPDVPE